MKAFVTTLVLLISFMQGRAQDYKKIITEDKYFDIGEYREGNFCEYAKADRYFFKGDTIIGNFVYKKLYSYRIITYQSVPLCPPYAVDTVPYFSGILMREDTVEQKIYRYNQGDSEIMLFDFTLNVGDTMMPKTGEWLIITSIDDVVLSNGETRKKYNLDNGQFYMEGIGSSNGVFSQSYSRFEYWTDLMCVKENNQPLYGNICTSSFVGINENGKNTFTVYPNPSNSNLFINNSTYPIKVEVLDLSSKKLLNQIITNEHSTININTLKPGAYLLKITDNDGNFIGSEKIFKQD